MGLVRELAELLYQVLTQKMTINTKPAKMNPKNTAGTHMPEFGLYDWECGPECTLLMAIIIHFLMKVGHYGAWQ